MPRSQSIWNYLPKAARTGRTDVSPLDVLTAWGVEDWGNGKPSYDSEYVGWCRVRLPNGWRISLEQFDFFLLDEHNQVRGDIRDAFKFDDSNPIIITSEDVMNAGISQEEWAAAFPPDEVRKEPPKPRLMLRTAIRICDSSNGAGEHSCWAEDPMSNHLFGIYKEPVSKSEGTEKILRLEQCVFDWLDEHYPDWRDHSAYWDTFVEVDERWSLSEEDVTDVAESLLAGKSDDELRAIRAEMGKGKKYTDYLVALQPKLVGAFDQTTDIPPFYVAFRVARWMKWKIYERTGLDYR